ncbi:MAG: D-alanine--D-alanine ligase family protein [bacterium]|nr:D-alanine--D-alanine ligase family protein [bacterium]
MKKRILLLFGGPSSEHEVSLQSAKSVYSNLNRDKYEILPVGIDKNGQWFFANTQDFIIDNVDYLKTKLNTDKMKLVTLERKDDQFFLQNIAGDEVAQVDLVLPVLHGPFGEDGQLQAELENIGVPYVFSDSKSSSLAMDKIRSKDLVKKNNITVAPEIILRKGDNFDPKDIIEKLSLPIVIKPNELGSSVGVTIAKNEKDLAQGIAAGFVYGNTVLLEKFIAGRELTVAVIGNDTPQALPVIEIIPKTSDWFDYQAKYSTGGSAEVCPAEIPDEVRSRVQRDAIKAFEIIGCRDLARVDFIWSKDDDELYFLEINTIPGMTDASLTPKAAKAANMSFKEFLDKIIEIAENRRG